MIKTNEVVADILVPVVCYVSWLHCNIQSRLLTRAVVGAAVRLRSCTDILTSTSKPYAFTADSDALPQQGPGVGRSAKLGLATDGSMEEKQAYTRDRLALSSPTAAK